MFDIKYNFFLDERGGQWIVRYYQVGVDEGDGFSGVVHDYVGGGEFQIFYFIDGAPAADLDEVDDPDDLDDDALEELVEARHPGLMAAIGAFLDQQTRPDDDDDPTYILPTAGLRAQFADPERDVVGNYRDGLIEVGGTSFG